MDGIILWNISGVKQHIEDLGADFAPDEKVELAEYYEIDELHNSEDLKQAIKDEAFVLMDHSGMLSIEDALDAITIESLYEDTQNEKWLYEEGSATRVIKYTQLHITGRPLVLEEGAVLELEEGADIIID